MLIGIVGKPSSGKSSFLNALTKSSIAKIGNYPFTTLKPNVGVGFAFKPCVCKEMNVVCGQCINELRPIPVKVIDVAGLVPDASKGKGMGNQFLSDLGQTDLLFHVIDCSGSLNEEGEDVEPGSHHPMKDIEFLETEIDAWIQGILVKDWHKVSRTARSNKTPLLDIFSTRLSGLKITKPQIKKVLSSKPNVYTAKIDDWNENLLFELAKDLRKLSKPIFLILNKIDKPHSLEYFQQIKTEFSQRTIIPTSALAEVVLQNFDSQGKIKYHPLKGSLDIVNVSEKEKISLNKIQTEILDRFGSTGIPNILSLAIEKLNYIIAYPVADTSHLTDQDGKVLPHVHLVPTGTTAKDLAKKIHKDLYDNFVCGIDARTNRRLADDYVLCDGDIIKIMSSK